MMPCATSWLIGLRSINFTFSAETNKQTNKQISSLLKNDRHPDLHFLYESQVQVITPLQSKYTETWFPYKIGQIKAAVQFVLYLPSALLGNLQGFVYWDF